jgi:hypothetical protein
VDQSPECQLLSFSSNVAQLDKFPGAEPGPDFAPISCSRNNCGQYYSKTMHQSAGIFGRCSEIGPHGRAVYKPHSSCADLPHSLAIVCRSVAPHSIPVGSEYMPYTNRYYPPATNHPFVCIYQLWSPNADERAP